MPTLQYIEDEKNAMLAKLDAELNDALIKRNAAPADSTEEQRWADAAKKIDCRRDKFLHCIFKHEDDSDEIKQAVEGLKAASADMTKAAARMKSATTFVSGLADLLGAVDKAISALS